MGEVCCSARAAVKISVVPVSNDEKLNAKGLA